MKLRYTWVDVDRPGFTAKLEFDEEYGLELDGVPLFHAYSANEPELDERLQEQIVELIEGGRRDDEEDVVSYDTFGGDPDYLGALRWQLIPENEEEVEYLLENFLPPHFPLHSKDDLDVAIDAALEKGEYIHPEGWSIYSFNALSISDDAPLELLDQIRDRGLKVSRGAVKNPGLKKKLMR